MVHISAIGADADAPSGICPHPKPQARPLILSAYAQCAVILRPSVIFGGRGSASLTAFASMSRLWADPAGCRSADTKFQPVSMSMTSPSRRRQRRSGSRLKPGIYELGGPEVSKPLRDLMKQMLQVIQPPPSDCQHLAVRFAWPRLMAFGFDMLSVRQTSGSDREQRCSDP